MFATDTLQKIKSIAQSFIDAGGINKSEEDVQSSYILQILRLLGWEADTWKINSRQEIKTGKKPDIVLIGKSGGAIFVIESKEAKVSLDGRYKDKTFVRQLSGYCKAEGVYWGILTNFIEWRIYNSYKEELYYNEKHFLIHNAGKKLTVNNADDEKLRNLFSKLQFGSLSAKKGRIDANPTYYPKAEEIRDEFFVKLKAWRKQLRNFLYAHYNSQYPVEQIDAQTQKILDRLIFIQVCFKKDIISQNTLSAVLLSEKRDYYDELKDKFKLLNDKFNTELFAPDVCDNFSIENELTEEIITGINGIDFSKVSPHIMGEVYEDYLGELLKENKKGITAVESKEKTKKKSQGIYYTPEYIVDFIIEHTLGEKLKACKTEREIEKIKVLDPACGSGSFLIKAYLKFLEAYREKSRKSKSGTLFYDIEIRKKILLHNIFGVDLDERAVEIAKLNLFITALDGLAESNVTGIKILPNLSLNIRCGNSLLSGSFNEISNGNEERTIFDRKSELNQELAELIMLKEQFYDEEENENKEDLLKKIQILEERINNAYNETLKNFFNNAQAYRPVNFDVLFCEIFKNKGFDVIIGNPPYIQLSMDKNFSKEYKQYLFQSFGSSMGRFNTFGFFIKKSVELIKDNGFSGLIIPNTLLTQEYYRDLRKFILDNTAINTIVNYDEMPFRDAVVENITLILSKPKKSGNKINLVNYKNHIPKTVKLNQSDYLKTYKNQFIKTGDNSSIKIKKDFLKSKHFLLGSIVNLNQAIALKHNRTQYLSDTKKNEDYKPVLDGRDVDRYQIKWNGNYLQYDINAIHSCKRTDIFTCKEKLFFRRVGSSLKAACDNKRFFALNTLVVMTLKDGHRYSIKYILGIFNSKAANYYYTNFLKSTKKVFSEIQARQIAQLPIPEINFNDKSGKAIHDKVVMLVDSLQELSKHPEKNDIKIKAKDRELDTLVCKLYGVALHTIEEKF